MLELGSHFRCICLCRRERESVVHLFLVTSHHTYGGYVLEACGVEWCIYLRLSRSDVRGMEGKSFCSLWLDSMEDYS